MQVSILGQVYFFENMDTSVPDLINVINEKIYNSGLLLSHLTIDGVDVFSDYEDYLLQHLSKIETIEVKVMTQEQLLDDILLSTKQYVRRAIPEVKNLSEDFYKGPTSETWHKLGQMLEAIQWLQQTSRFLQEREANQALREFAATSLNFSEILGSLEEAVEQQDMILIGDIIQYELLPCFEMIVSQLGQIIGDEVERNDLN